MKNDFILFVSLCKSYDDIITSAEILIFKIKFINICAYKNRYKLLSSSTVTNNQLISYNTHLYMNLKLYT